MLIWLELVCSDQANVPQVLDDMCLIPPRDGKLSSQKEHTYLGYLLSSSPNRLFRTKEHTYLG